MSLEEFMSLLMDNLSTYSDHVDVDIDNLIKSLMDESKDYVEYAKYAIDCDELDPNDLFDMKILKNTVADNEVFN